VAEEVCLGDPVTAVAATGEPGRGCCRRERLFDVLAIRELGPDDWRLWRKLRLDALAEAPYAFRARLVDWQADNDTEDQWRGRLSIPGSFNVIAESDGEPVGMASGVRATDDSAAEVISMWVSPAARGRGVAKALVNEIAHWAQDMGIRVLRLSVAEGNSAASALYQRCGFRFTGELGDMVHDGAERELVMVKQLTPHAPVD
jgi:ribosomal protein S18 acetylase RimI-like enzyme